MALLLSRTPALVTTAGKCTWDTVTVLGQELAQTLCSSPLVALTRLAQAARQWCKGNTRARKCPGATCLLVPGTCPHSPWNRESTKAVGFSPDSSLVSPGPLPPPQDSDLICPGSGLGIGISKGSPPPTQGFPMHSRAGNHGSRVTGVHPLHVHW